MNANVPSGAAMLLDFIGKAETGVTGSEAYGVVVFNQRGKRPKPLTEYTIEGLRAAQKVWAKNGWSVKGKKVRGSAAGKYQIIRPTLLGLVSDLGIPGSAKFSADLQDRLGYRLLTIRGWQAFTSGQVTPAAFALQLAKEWASMPVLSTVQGRSRIVHRGDSYYAGDGVNSSQKRAEELEAVLIAALATKSPVQPVPATPPPNPAPQPQTPAGEAPNVRGIVGIVIAILVGAAGLLTGLWYGLLALLDKVF